ncbi:chemotaxis protein CheW [Teredinibacter purpureus]|uniref:chemotaxis protein CheW n=1 Tax=Teredinibacter purpureus TaxID=2731756 RepID=UPI0005F80D82|nr:chemotaxis protein CheW [Teredinibacter purpureus]
MQANVNVIEETLPIGVNDDSRIIDTGASETERKWSRIRAYGFSLGHFNFLLPQGLFCELIAHVKLAPLPNSPQHFSGLVAVRGNLIPVYTLHGLLDMPTPTKTFVFVMGNGAKSAALLVAEKPEMVDFNALQEVPVNQTEVPDLLHSSVTSCYKLDGKEESKPWLSIDHIRLFKFLSGLV